MKWYENKAEGEYRNKCKNTSQNQKQTQSDSKLALGPVLIFPNSIWIIHYVHRSTKEGAVTGAEEPWSRAPGTQKHMIFCINPHFQTSGFDKSSIFFHCLPEFNEKCNITFPSWTSSAADLKLWMLPSELIYEHKMMHRAWNIWELFCFVLFVGLCSRSSHILCLFGDVDVKVPAYIRL